MIQRIRCILQKSLLVSATKARFYLQITLTFFFYLKKVLHVGCCVIKKIKGLYFSITYHIHILPCCLPMIVIMRHGHFHECHLTRISRGFFTVNLSSYYQQGHTIKNIFQDNNSNSSITSFCLELFLSTHIFNRCYLNDFTLKSYILFSHHRSFQFTLKLKYLQIIFYQLYLKHSKKFSTDSLNRLRFS